MSGISGYGSPKRLIAQNQEANHTSQPTLPSNTQNIQRSNQNRPENNNEASQTVAKESVTTQSNMGSEIKNKNPSKVPVTQSESSYISVLTDTSQSYEALYSSEDDSLPKVIDEHDEIRKSCIVIRGSSINIHIDDNECNNTTETKVQAKKGLRCKTGCEIKDKSDGTGQMSNPLLKTNESQDNIKKNEDDEVKETLQTQSAKSVNDQAQFSQAENNDKKSKPAASTAKHDETKTTGNFTTQYLLSADKLDETKFKKLAQTRKLDDNADQRRKNVINKQDLRTNINCHEISNNLAPNTATTNKMNLQKGENCPDKESGQFPAGVNNQRNPIGMSPGKLDVLNDVLNTGEGTLYNLGDNLLDIPGLHTCAPDNKIILTTDSQIENLRKIKRILEDNLKCANNPDEKDEVCNQDAAVSNLFSDPNLAETREDDASVTKNYESGQTKPEEMVTEKNSKADNLKAEIPKQTEAVVEAVKVIPDPRRSSMTSGLKLKETQAQNPSHSLKQPISKRASIANRSEDASEIIQIILPEDKSVLAGDLSKSEPKDSCKPCPGIRPSGTTCIFEPPRPGEDPPPQEPSPERTPPPFQCFEPPNTPPEYEGSGTSQNSQTPSRLRLWWQKLRDKVLSVVMRVYNCFHCERICPMSQARIQSPNTSAAYEPTKISSNAALIHSMPSILNKPTGSEYPQTPDTPKNGDVVNSESLEPEKSKSATSGPEKTKSTRFDLEKTEDEDLPQMPIAKSTHIVPSR